MHSSDDQQRSRPRKAAARRVGRLGFERLESRDMLAADAAAAEVYVDVPSDMAWDYDQWFAAFAGTQDMSSPEPAIVSGDRGVAADQTSVWDDTYFWDDSYAWWDDNYGWGDTTGEDPAVVEDPVVIEEPVVIVEDSVIAVEDPVAPEDCVVEPSAVGEEAPSIPGDAADDESLPMPTDEPAVNEGDEGTPILVGCPGVEDPILVVCPGVIEPPEPSPGPDGTDSKSDWLLDEYSRFLALNETWFDDHGGNAIQPQVMTASRHLPWIELPTPGAANAFDAWYSLTYLDGLPADGSDPIFETGPGDEDVAPPVPVEGSEGGTVDDPRVLRTQVDGFPTRPPVAYSTAGTTQSSGRNWSAWMPFLGMGGFGGASESESETEKLAKARRRVR